MHYEDRNSKVNDTYHYGGTWELFQQERFWQQKIMTFIHSRQLDSDWEKADTEGTYASYTNGSDYVNIYKYSLDDVNIAIAKCNDTYEACYQTVYSEGNSLYMTVGYAKDADDISDVRKFVEYISYPGNPSLTRQAE